MIWEKPKSASNSYTPGKEAEYSDDQMEDIRDHYTFGDGALSFIMQVRHNRDASWAIIVLEKVVLMLQRLSVNKWSDDAVETHTSTSDLETLEGLSIKMCSLGRL